MPVARIPEGVRFAAAAPVVNIAFSLIESSKNA